MLSHSNLRYTAAPCGLGPLWETEVRRTPNSTQFWRFSICEKDSEVKNNQNDNKRKICLSLQYYIVSRELALINHTCLLAYFVNAKPQR